MKAIGMNGYLELTRTVMETTRALQDGIRSIPGLDILSDPEVSVFAYGPTDKKLNIFAVADQMEERGWLMDRLQRPEALHAMVTPRHAPIVGEFIADLRDCVEYVRRHPKESAKGNAALYGMIARVPFRGLVRSEALKIMERMYGPEMKMPL
mgnify:FL=1